MTPECTKSIIFVLRNFSFASSTQCQPPTQRQLPQYPTVIFPSTPPSCTVFELNYLQGRLWVRRNAALGVFIRLGLRTMRTKDWQTIFCINIFEQTPSGGPTIVFFPRRKPRQYCPSPQSLAFPPRPRGPGSYACLRRPYKIRAVAHKIVVRLYKVWIAETKRKSGNQRTVSTRARATQKQPTLHQCTKQCHDNSCATVVAV